MRCDSNSCLSPHADNVKRARTLAHEAQAPRPIKLPLRDALGPMGQALALDLDLFTLPPEIAQEAHAGMHDPGRQGGRVQPQEAPTTTAAVFNPPFAPVPHNLLLEMDLEKAATFTFYVQSVPASTDPGQPRQGPSVVSDTAAGQAGLQWMVWGPEEARTALLAAGASAHK